MGQDVLERMEEFILNVPLGIGVRCYRVKRGCTSADAVETWFLSSVFMEMGGERADSFHWSHPWVSPC